MKTEMPSYTTDVIANRVEIASAEAAATAAAVPAMVEITAEEDAPEISRQGWEILHHQHRHRGESFRTVRHPGGF